MKPRMKSMKNDESKIIQCSVVGDGQVGKTSLVKKFVHEDNTDQETTVFDNFAGDISREGSKYTVSVFDTSGDHNSEGLRALPYAESDVVVICYSAVDRKSFDNVSDFWVPEIKRYSKKMRSIILVATQLDLLRSTDSTDHVTSHEGLSLAETIGAAAFVENYIKDNIGVFLKMLCHAR